MTREIQLPHHKLIAYEVAKELLVAVRQCHVRDAGLRDQAMRSAKSACLNAAEGAGRVSRADKARVFAIARAEAGEAAAAIEIACLSGDANAGDLAKVVSIANRLIAMLTKLIRRSRWRSRIIGSCFALGPMIASCSRIPVR